jgi:uncharacterized protein (DUF342 family)
MWQNLLSMNDGQNKVIATFNDEIKLEQRLSKTGLSDALVAMDASKFFLLEEELDNFIQLVNERKEAASSGIVIAEKRNADVAIRMSEDKMLAHMVVSGAYGGRGLRGSELIHALAKEHITKGINKLALKKVLQISQNLTPGEEYTQAIAQGKKPVSGRDARIKPLVADVTKQILAPRGDENSTKVDMRNLGETISVEVKTSVLERVPPTAGVAGFTVQGEVIPAIPGKDIPLKVGKGTEVDPNNPNILLASISGMPLIKDGTVHIENALCMESVSVKTGHVKFKGCLVVTGNIEAGMVVRATGSITVGGFIESADVQAQGDIFVRKGIIGRTLLNEGVEKSCTVKSGGTIKANYAQYSSLQAHDDIHLAIHSLSNDIRCGGNLTVLDSRIQNGTLSGGNTKVGGRILCYNLGLEGDTPTYVECFACYLSMKARIEQLREKYLVTQDITMQLVRKELEFKKRPKAERSEEMQTEIEAQKRMANEEMVIAKNTLEAASSDLEERLTTTTIEVKKHVYTHVTVRFGDEKVVTKKEHGSSIFSFNQYEIACKSSLIESDIGGE